MSPGRRCCSGRCRVGQRLQGATATTYPHHRLSVIRRNQPAIEAENRLIFSRFQPPQRAVCHKKEGSSGGPSYSVRTVLLSADRPTQCVPSYSEALGSRGSCGGVASTLMPYCGRPSGRSGNSPRRGPSRGAWPGRSWLSSPWSDPGWPDASAGA